MTYVMITRVVGRNKTNLPAVEFPKRKIRLKHKEYVGIFDKNGTITIYLPVRSKTDNVLSVDFSIEEYRKSCYGNANRDAGIRRFVVAKADEAVRRWINNAPTPRVKYSRQREYDEVGASCFVEIIEYLTKRLCEKTNIKIKSSIEIHKANRERLTNGRTQTTQATQP